MADSFHIRIDLPTLAANLGAAENRPTTQADARQFLIDNDFIPLPDGVWLCEEISLGLLDDSEIISREPAD